MKMLVTRTVCALAVAMLAGCAEQPRCVNRGTPERERIVVECNAGEIPVCGSGNEPYDPDTGALKPVSPLEDGTCNGIMGLCRPAALCMGVGAVVCPGGLPAQCLPGVQTTAMRPRTDAGPPPPVDGGSDAGSDAGGEDAGTDAGGADAGDGGP